MAQGDRHRPLMQGPWPGLTAQAFTGVPANAMQACSNWLEIDGYLQSRNRFLSMGQADGSYPLLVGNFQDINNNWHSYYISGTNLYYLTFNTSSLPVTVTFNLISTLAPINFPASAVGMYRKVHFSGDGGQQILVTDGSSTLGVDTNVFGARYLGSLDSHLIGCYTNESGTIYPYRVRWSGSGDPTDYTSFSSGLSDLVDCWDGINGYATLNYYGYVFRENGMTIMAPTGNGQSPFSFEPLSNAPQGVGVRYIGTLAVFGSTCAFVSSDDVYLFDGTRFSGIGGIANSALSQALEGRGIVYFSSLVPFFSEGGEVKRLFYVLVIGSQIWVCNVKTSSWVTWQVGSSTFTPTCLGMVTT